MWARIVKKRYQHSGKQAELCGIYGEGTLKMGVRKIVPLPLFPSLDVFSRNLSSSRIMEQTYFIKTFSTFPFFNMGGRGLALLSETERKKLFTRKEAPVQLRRNIYFKETIRDQNRSEILSTRNERSKTNQCSKSISCLTPEHSLIST